MLCRFVFKRRWSFQVVLCRPLSFLLSHNLAKVPPSAVPSIVSVAIVVCVVDHSAQITLNCTQKGETHTHVRILRRAQTRQLSERSLERSFAAERIPVVWSHFRPPNKVLNFIHSTSHTGRLAENSSRESRSAESSEITRNDRTALNLSPSKPARSSQKKIWRRLRERLLRAARRLDEDSLEIHSPAVESIHSR